MVHQLVANSVCLPSGAKQVVYSRFFGAFLFCAENSCLLQPKLCCESSERDPKQHVPGLTADLTII